LFLEYFSEVIGDFVGCSFGAPSFFGVSCLELVFGLFRFCHYGTVLVEQR
jgi:hypothetical protein